MSASDAWDLGGFVGNLKLATDKLAANARGAAHLVGEYILAESMQQVPFREGDLQSSGAVADDYSDPNKPTTIIYYDTPYARRQHEELTWFHPQPGRKAKYLEDPMNEAARGPAQKIIQRKLGL